MEAFDERAAPCRQNIQTAKQMYEAFGRGDVQAILDRVTDDVDCSIGCPNPRSTPSDSAATSSASRAPGAPVPPPTRQA